MVWLRLVMLVGLAWALAACGGAVPAQLAGERGWVAMQGGVLEGGTWNARTTAAAARVAGGLPVRAWVLDSAAVTAYSYTDGNLLLTRGLVDLSTDEELAAAMAHELGHLLADGRLPAGAYASAVLATAGMEKESRADAVGAEVLAAHGIPRRVMVAMLAKVARASHSAATRASLRARIAALGK